MSSRHFTAPAAAVFAAAMAIGCGTAPGRAGSTSDPSADVVLIEPAPPLRSVPDSTLRVAAGAGAVCFNESTTDCNQPGTTLSASSAWVDPEPPSGFSQCAGFINTDGDDVSAGFLDGCLGATSLRIRVFSRKSGLEEDIVVVGTTRFEAWPNFNYLSGELSQEKRTNWGDTTFFTTTDGRDACMNAAAPGGTTFGSGNKGVAVIAGANTGADEYRINCEGPPLPGRRIGLYRRNDAVRVRAVPADD